MEHSRYVARKRARFNAICGPVNIPYGTELRREGEFLTLNGRRICADTSQNAHDFFSQNDDGNGLERGIIVNVILALLKKQDAGHAARWEKVWNDPLCQKYKRPEHEDHWLWNHEFFNAPIEDLRHIAALIGAKNR